MPAKSITPDKEGFASRASRLSPAPRKTQAGDPPLAEPLPGTPEWQAEWKAALNTDMQADNAREDHRRKAFGHVYRITETECGLYTEFRRHDDLEGVIADHLENGVGDNENCDHAVWHNGRVRVIVRLRVGHAPRVLRIPDAEPEGGAS